MGKNYILGSADELMAVLKEMEEKYPDRVFVTGVTTGGKASAPTKKREHYQHQLNHAFAPECFVTNGVSALISGGGFYIAHLPKEKINPEHLPKSSETTETA